MKVENISLVKMKNLLKIEQLSKEEILEIIKLTEQIESYPEQFSKKLSGKSLATMFFQPSTRTRISFSLAMQKLGGNVVSLYESKYEKEMLKKESFEDSIRIIGDYVDVICLRHSFENAQQIAKKNTSSKIINCGNGNDQHPTQAILDLYTIWKKFKRLNNLKISIIGDLKNSRSAHSLLIALSLFDNNQISLISPNKLRIPLKYRDFFNQNTEEKEGFELESEDIIYMAGFPPNDEVQNEQRIKYQMNLEKAKTLKSNSIILSPLPRIDEITKEIDNFQQARYFEQSKNGPNIRMAILLKIFED
jgi:aspartate carbamoyltransferase catalytic subunit